MKNFHLFRSSLTFSVFFVLICFFAEAKIWVVSVKNYSFTPFNLTHVQGGDTIKWLWVSGIHSTTSTSVPDGAMPWDHAINQDSTAFIYIPRVNGTFFYKSTPDTANSMTGTFVVSGVNGIANDNGKREVILYPNPFQDQVAIVTPYGQTALQTLEVYDASGKLMLVKNFGPSLSLPCTLELKNLPQGVFMFKFTDISKRTILRRAIHY